MKLSRQDFIIGAIDRMAVRRGISKATVEQLLVERAGYTSREAHNLVGVWFDKQYRHGGIEYRRQEYLASRGAAS